MTRNPNFLKAMDEVGETTDQTGAMLVMLMDHLTEATENNREHLSNETLLNYVWALKAQHERAERAIQAISQATATVAA